MPRRRDIVRTNCENRENRRQLNEALLPAGRQGETNRLSLRVGLPAAHAASIDVDETRARVVADAATLQR